MLIIESRRDVRIQAGVLTPDKEYPTHNKPRRGGRVFSKKFRKKYIREKQKIYNLNNETTTHNITMLATDICMH